MQAMSKAIKAIGVGAIALIIAMGIGILVYPEATAGEKKTDWPPSTKTFDPESVKRETFHLEDIEQLLLFPPDISPEGRVNALNETFLRLFPLGTPIDEIRVYFEKEIQRPEIRETDHLLQLATSSKRFRLKESEDTITHYYIFMIPPNVAQHHMLNKTSPLLVSFPDMAYVFSHKLWLEITARADKKRRLISLKTDVSG